MAFLKCLVVLLSLTRLVSGSSLLDYSAARGDNPSIIGTLNLEAARDVSVPANTNDLYIKLGIDPRGTAALHYHRIKGDIRAEYHALNGKTQADKTYYIGYKFMLAEVQKSLMIWQFKEYEANNANDGGANIPLALEVQSNNLLQFQYQSSNTASRVAQWSKTVAPNTVYSVGLVINTATPGSVQLYFNGKLQTFNNGKQTLTATTFPGRSDPKFGAYRGEEVQIDTYVYDIQIGTTMNDIKRAAGT